MYLAIFHENSQVGMSWNLSGVAQLCTICATKALQYSLEHSRLANGADVTKECPEEQKCSTRLQSTLGLVGFSTRFSMRRDSFWRLISGQILQRSKTQGDLPWFFALHVAPRKNIKVFIHTVSEFAPGKQVCPHFFILLHGLSFLFAGLDQA